MDNSYDNMNLFDFTRLVYNKLVSLFKWILEIVLRLIRLCFRYWYVMIICVALGLFAARMWTKPKFTRYHGQATITFMPRMKQIIEEGLLSYLSQSYETKRDVFGLPDSVQLAMRGFYTYNVIDAKFDANADYIDKEGSVEYTDTLSMVMPDHLTIRVNLQGCYDFYSLERSLILWFNSQDQFSIPDKRHKEAMRERLEYVKHEIQRSDSFLSHYYFSETPKIEIFNEKVKEKKGQLIYDEMLGLIREKHYLENELAENPDVINFQTHFYIDSIIPKEKYIIGLCSGFVLGILISLLIKYWANIKNFLLTK